MSEDKIAQLEQMAKADPDDSLTWYMLGLEYARARRDEEAADALLRCLALSPTHTAAMRHLGDAYRHLRRREQAREAYERAIDLAEQTGDLQVAKEARAMLGKLDRQ